MTSRIKDAICVIAQVLYVAALLLLAALCVLLVVGLICQVSTEPTGNIATPESTASSAQINWNTVRTATASAVATTVTICTR